MKRLIPPFGFPLALIALTFAFLPAIAGDDAAAKAPNLAPVPGFEKAEGDWWRHYLALGNAQLDTEKPFEGEISLRIAAIPEDKQKAQWNTCQMGKESETAVEIAEGERYRLALHARSTLVGDQGKFGLRQVDADKKTVRFDWQTVPADAEWKPYELVVTVAPKAKYLQIYYMAGPKATEGAVWFDAVNLAKVVPTALVTLENDRVAFGFDPDNGFGLARIFDKSAGRELLDATRADGESATLWRVALFEKKKWGPALTTGAAKPNTASNGFPAASA